MQGSTPAAAAAATAGVHWQRRCCRRRPAVAAPPPLPSCWDLRSASPRLLRRAWRAWQAWAALQGCRKEAELAQCWERTCTQPHAPIGSVTRQARCRQWRAAQPLPTMEPCALPPAAAAAAPRSVAAARRALATSIFPSQFRSFLNCCLLQHAVAGVCWVEVCGVERMPCWLEHATAGGMRLAARLAAISGHVGASSPPPGPLMRQAGCMQAACISGGGMQLPLPATAAPLTADVRCRCARERCSGAPCACRITPLPGRTRLPVPNPTNAAGWGGVGVGG